MARLQVPQEYYDKYKNIDPLANLSQTGMPIPPLNDKLLEDARRVYAMVNNIDDNLARLLKVLKDLNLENNTLVVFMTDNGPQQFRYLAGMRGKKGFVFEGGVRVPSFWRLPICI